jgi:hypothetical protein
MVNLLNPEKSAELSHELFELGKIELVRFLKLTTSGSNTGDTATEIENTSSFSIPPSHDSQSQAIPAATSSDAPKPLLSKRRRLAQGATATSVKRDTTVDEQIAKFIRILDEGDFVPEVNCFDFWREHSEDYPAFADLALQMLSIPATSASAERLFSAAGVSASGRRTTIGPALLEAEAIAKYNKKLHN